MLRLSSSSSSSSSSPLLKKTFSLLVKQEQQHQKSFNNVNHVGNQQQTRIKREVVSTSRNKNRSSNSHMVVGRPISAFIMSVLTPNQRNLVVIRYFTVYQTNIKTGSGSGSIICQQNQHCKFMPNISFVENIIQQQNYQRCLESMFKMTKIRYFSTTVNNSHNNNNNNTSNYYNQQSILKLEEELKRRLKDNSINNNNTNNNGNNGQQQPIPTSSFLVVLRGLATKDTNIRDAHLRAEKLIGILERQYETLLQQQQHQQQQHSNDRRTSTVLNNIHDYMPIAECYTCVIQAWGNAIAYEDAVIAITRCKSWLHRQLYNVESAIRPTTETFDSFLDICTRGKTRKQNKSVREELLWKHAMLAQNTLLLMIERSQYEHEIREQIKPLAPTIDSFNFVIRGWTRCRTNVNIADRALTVLQYFESYQRSVFNDATVVPNGKTLVLIMDAVAVLAKLKVDAIVKRQRRQQELLIQSTPRTRKLQQQQQQQQQATTIQEQEHSRGQSSRKSNSIERNDVVEGEQLDWFDNAVADTSQNGMAEIELLEQLLNFGGWPVLNEGMTWNVSMRHVDTSTVAYNVLLGCWANLARINPNASYEAEELLNEMIQFERRRKDDGSLDPRAPDTTSYFNVINAWTKTNDPNRAHHALRWLSKQWQDYETYNNDPKLEPTTRTYNVLLEMFSEAGNVLEVERLASDLLRRYELTTTLDDNDERRIRGGLRPTTETFLYLIRVWMKTASDTGNLDAFDKGVQWLNTLWNREDEGATNGGASIDMYSIIFNTSLQLAAINQVHGKTVLDVTMTILNRIRSSHHKISFFHYSKVLQIGLTALSHSPEQQDERYKFISQIIQDCQKDGLVSRHIFHSLWNGPIRNNNNNTYRRVSITNDCSNTSSSNNINNSMPLWTTKDSECIIKEFFPVWPIPYNYTRNVKVEFHKPREKDLHENDNDNNIPKHHPEQEQQTTVSMRSG